MSAFALYQTLSIDEPPPVKKPPPQVDKIKMIRLIEPGCVVSQLQREQR